MAFQEVRADNFIHKMSALAAECCKLDRKLFQSTVSDYALLVIKM